MKRRMCRCLETRVKCWRCGKEFGKDAWIYLVDKATRVFSLSANTDGKYLNYDENGDSPYEIPGTEHYECSECEAVLRLNDKQVVKIISDYQKREDGEIGE